MGGQDRGRGGSYRSSSHGVRSSLARLEELEELEEERELELEELEELELLEDELELEHDSDDLPY